MHIMLVQFDCSLLFTFWLKEYVVYCETGAAGHVLTWTNIKQARWSRVKHYSINDCLLPIVLVVVSSVVN